MFSQSIRVSLSPNAHQKVHYEVRGFERFPDLHSSIELTQARDSYPQREGHFLGPSLAHPIKPPPPQITLLSR